MAHPLDRVLGSVVIDKLEADHQRVSSAQYFAALVFRDEAMFRRIESHSPVKTSHTAEKLETPVSPGLAGCPGRLKLFSRV